MYKKIFFLCAIVLFFYKKNTAQYYNSAFGLNGVQLKTALHNIIKNHNAQAWPLWSYFYTTDDTLGNKVWDIYSDIPGNTPPYTYTLGTNQCGTYSDEGECYNHEHSWPSTYFNDATPMRTDLHHVFPTDGYVNNKRSNFPYGKVNNANWTSDNGSKLGASTTYSGYTDKVFEPIDAYKGDLARAYFYMSTRYENEDGGWTNWVMASGASLTQDAINLLLSWHHNDPVSQKEIERNHAIYAIQGNRNPFIDYPVFADCIWSNTDCIGVGTRDIIDARVSFDILPNPSRDYFTMSTSAGNISSATIYDMLGNVIWKKSNVHESAVTLSAEDWCDGNYVIFIITEKGAAKKLFTKN